ncbi:hypothetical protein KY289_023793 [Solanum tuberosum]|nr:hypothetical protein KY289_023793 [Solanum tuberosum]
MIEGDSLYVENVIEDVNQFTVRCREYDLIKIPCAHAMSALRSKYDNEYDSINVVPLDSEWCVPEELLNVNILPPLVDTKLGRKRIRGVGENFKSKRRNKCSICKRTGHKRTTCLNSKIS